MSEFKLNVSVKIGDKQLTARADERDELEENLAYLLETYGKDATIHKTPVSSQSSESEICPIHNAPMKEKEGQYGKFFSHYVGKYPDGTWCNGKEK